MRNDPMTKAVDLPLFRDLSREEAALLIRAQGGEKLSVPEGAVVTEAGAGKFMVLVSGMVQLVRYGVRGERYMIDYTLPGGLIGYADLFLDRRIRCGFSIAGRGSELLRLSSRQSPDAPDELWEKLEQGLQRIVAGNNARLMQKADIISRRTVQEKIRAFLSYEMQIHGSRVFDIPLNRQELADYICVDRTTLSTELTRMASKGLLRTRRSHFELLSDSFDSE